MATDIGPRIGLDGEAEYKKALSEIIAQQKTLNSEMKKVSSEFDSNSTSIKKNAQQHEILGKAIQNQEKKVEALQKAVDDSTKKYGEASTVTQKYKAQLNNAEAELNRLNKEFADTSPLNSWCSAIGEAGDKLQSIGGVMTSAGQTATKYLTTPIVAAGAAALQASVNFESGMARVQATLGITSDDMSDLNGESVNTLAALENLAREMGSNTMFSATEAADAINTLAMAGMSTQQIYDALPSVLNLAAAGGIGIQEAADLATGALAGFGLKTEDTVEVADKLAKLASKAKGSVQSFGEGMSVVAGQASITGQSLDTVSVALGLLGNHNISAAEGGTMLQRVLKNLYQPTDAAKKAMEELGVSAYNADGSSRPLQEVLQDLNTQLGTLSEEDYNSVMGQIFDTSALKGAAFLIEESGTAWDELAGYIDESAGAAQNMADTIMGSTEGQIITLKSSISELAISMGQELIPYLQQGVTWVQSIVNKFNSMDDKTKKLIVTVGAFLAAAGPLLIFAGKVVTSIGSIMTAAKAIPTMIGTLSKVGGAFVTGAKAALSGLFTLVMAHPFVAVAAAVVGVLIALWTKCEWFRDGVKAVINAVWTWVQNIGTNVKNAISGVGTFFTTAMNNVKTFTGNIITGIKTLWSNGLNAVKTTVSTIFGNVYNTIKSKLDAARDFVKGVIDKIKGFFNFSWSLPSLKMPHITITGSFSLVPPSVPKFSIDWYAKAMQNGMILNGATIFGAAGNKLLAGGEAGPEAVVGVSSLLKMIREAVGYGLSAVRVAPVVNNTFGATNIYIYAAEGQSAEEIADLAAERVNEAIRAEREVFA